ncbi:MAG: DUF3592 domain-containing protein [Candidatus Rifleibacteriota bacterium]
MQHSRHSRKGFIIVIAIPFMLAGIFLIGRSLNQFYTWFASGNWPVVEASVIEAELFHVGKNSRDGATTGIRGSFSYEFNNQRYTSTQFDITGGSNKNVEEKKSKLAVLLEAKAQGKKLQAYVNPANPSEAYIFREISFDMFGFIIIGLISLGLGWLLGRGSQFWPGSSSRQTADSVK